jgi:ribosomal-protein-alanine N-acetyltransferase
VKDASFVALAEEHIEPILKIEAESNGSPWSRRSFEQEIGHAPSEFIVARRKGEIVGFAGAWIVADECHVTTIAVDPAVRRQGLGRAMMVELLHRCQERGATCSTLEVRAGNVAAIKMYEGLGFVRAGVRKAYYPNNREDAVIMWLNDLEGWKP